MRLTLTKHHGLGNDFLVVFHPHVDDLPALARRLCDRRRGIGADGLLIGESRGGGFAASMVLYNADGSRAEMSGNGIRCLAQAMASARGDRRRQTSSPTPARLVDVWRRPTIRHHRGQRRHGPVTPIAAPAGWDGPRHRSDASGQPSQRRQPARRRRRRRRRRVDLLALGRKVPDVNLELVEPGPEPHAITMRVHERGAGITEACGTGACASAWAAASWGLVAAGVEEITVHMDGGDAKVRLHQRRPGRAHRPGHLRRHRHGRVDEAGRKGAHGYNEALGATLIERTKREQIVLVGVTLPGHTEATPRPASTSWPCWSTPPAPTRPRASCSAATRPTTPGSSARARPTSCSSICLAVDADTVVFDNELTPAQQFNLEKLLGRTAIDRTAVILDIFAQNAHTLEGKAQVELALLRYRLPRLRRGANAKLSQQRGGVGSRFGSRRDQARGRSPPHHAPHHQARSRPERSLGDPRAAAQEPNAQRPCCRDHRRLHQRRQVHVAQPPHRRRRAGRGPPVRHARSHHAPPVAARRRAGAAHRHRRLRPPPAARAGRGVQEHARGRGRGRPPRARRRRSARRSRRARSTPCARCWPRSAPTRCPSCWCSTRPTAPEDAAEAGSPAPRGSVRVSARTGEGIDLFLQTPRRSAAALTTVVELLIPYERGDVLAAVHREGEVVSTSHEDNAVRVRARWPTRPPGGWPSSSWRRLARHLTAAARCRW